MRASIGYLMAAATTLLACGGGDGGDGGPDPDGPICRAAGELDIWDDAGAFDPDGYRALAAAYATLDASGFRFGASYEAYHPDPEDFPTQWKPEDRVLHQDMGNPDTDYQVGGDQEKAPGGYNSAEGQLAYIPDGEEPGDAGLDSLAVLDVAYAVVTERPKLPWVLGGGGHPDPVTQIAEGIDLNGGPIGAPVGMARAYGNDIWSMDAVVVFASGLVATTGTFGSGGNSHIFLKLPAHKVPTAVAVTNSSELALVTVWDTEALRGELAVIALAGPATPGFWGDWPDLHPGLWNTGQIGAMKLLGYVELPQLVAPVAVAAATDVRHNMITTDDTVLYDLDDEPTRQRFIDGDLAGRGSTAGFAMVLSRAEKKVAFVDLEPLLAALHEQYFTTPEKYAATRDQGPAASQWPYTFDHAPAMRPTVTRIITMDECPTAVEASLDARRGDLPDFPTNTGRALIATEDGTLHAFDVAGLASPGPADADAIVASGTTAVGQNPTDIVQMLQDQRSFAVVSRGDRRIDFLDGDGTGTFTVERTLRDSRMLDPVSAQDVLWFGNQVPLLTVSDFLGKQALAYRYGDVILHFFDGQVYGPGEDGTAEFECGGVYPVTGYPFLSSNTNVP